MKLKIGNKLIESSEVLPILKTEPIQQISKKIQRIKEGLTDSLIRYAKKTSPDINSINDIPSYNEDGLFKPNPELDEKREHDPIKIGFPSPFNPVKRTNIMNNGGIVK